MRSELLVSTGAGWRRAALREDGVTVELRVEHEGDRSPAGRIVKARVTRVLPGIQSAFLDIGATRDAFLHVSDLLLPDEVTTEPVLAEEVVDLLSQRDEAEGSEDEAPGTGLPRRLPAGSRAAPIQDRLREGRDLLVQVAREGIGNKGARVSCFIALAGRFLVYLPQLSFRGISRRIPDPEERARLREVIDGIKDVLGGFIVRTAGEGADPAAFHADAVALGRLWHGIQAMAAAAASPSVVFSEPDLLIRMLRDAPGDGLDRVELDDPSDHERALQYLSQVAPAVATRVRLHAGPRSLFEAHGIDQEVERALRPKVWLPSGGSIVVQQTEALVSIDVNTGKFVGSRHPEQTVLRTNLEAAAEIARQIRLRDLGGIIVIDFIDMEDPESRRRVIDSLQNALRRDRARTKIVGLSDLGLLQLTRKRTRTALEGSLTRPCPTCGGHGRVRRAAAVAREALEEVRRIWPDLDQRPLTLRVHPDVVPAVERALEGADRGGPWDLGDHILVEADPTLHPDHFDVILR